MGRITVEGQDVADAISNSSGVTARANSGVATPRRGQINVVQGGGMSVSVVDDGTEIDITISNSAQFPGFGGTPPADSGSGSAGWSSQAARSDHVHPLSSAYLAAGAQTVRVAYQFIQGTTNTLSIVPGFTPRISFWLFHVDSNAFNMGIATSTWYESYALVGTAGGTIGGGNGVVGVAGLADLYQVNSFGSGLVRALAPHSYALRGSISVIGDNA